MADNGIHQPPAAGRAGTNWADASTRDSSGSHPNGWVSIRVRLIAALSTPASTSRAARRRARALAQRNDPVSVVKPA
ncbi:hypothetical protein I550_3728 [Mycobacterium intracellulare 1956]|uniref:Uncharacterized protein n=1 Tax=Mycobacterium intracellulare 1956 TaxID=1299331 RepID=X8CJF5_MYCIT|nr:hypothetical protein I550_3728 [Mycobacterium intracellulare 1956]